MITLCHIGRLRWEFCSSSEIYAIYMHCVVYRRGLHYLLSTLSYVPLVMQCMCLYYETVKGGHEPYRCLDPGRSKIRNLYPEAKRLYGDWMNLSSASAFVASALLHNIARLVSIGIVDREVVFSRPVNV